MLALFLDWIIMGTFRVLNEDLPNTALVPLTET